MHLWEAQRGRSSQNARNIEKYIKYAKYGTCYYDIWKRIAD